MARFQKLTDLVDDICFQRQGTKLNPHKGNRRHLGASIIGKKCKREIWYSFRWAHTKSGFPGRIIRLSDRGQGEESRFVEWLKMACAEVSEIDPATGKQYSFKSVMGHYSGSLDGIAKNIPFLEEFGVDPTAEILTEFKTHGDASFKKLVAANSVKIAKPEHYTQMCTYMEKYKLPAALYCAVNKNDDDLYFELILADPEHANEKEQLATEIIHSRTPPNRVSNSASWFECKFCDFRQNCHFGVALAKNCRTCRFSVPIDDGRWHCEHYGKTIPVEFEQEGCGEWKQIND